MIQKTIGSIVILLGLGALSPSYLWIIGVNLSWLNFERGSVGALTGVLLCFIGAIMWSQTR